MNAISYNKTKCKEKKNQNTWLFNQFEMHNHWEQEQNNDRESTGLLLSNGANQIHKKHMTYSSSFNKIHFVSHWLTYAMSHRMVIWIHDRYVDDTFYLITWHTNLLHISHAQLPMVNLWEMWTIQRSIDSNRLKHYSIKRHNFFNMYNVDSVMKLGLSESKIKSAHFQCNEINEFHINKYPHRVSPQTHQEFDARFTSLS